MQTGRCALSRAGRRGQTLETLPDGPRSNAVNGAARRTLAALAERKPASRCGVEVHPEKSFSARPRRGPELLFGVGQLALGSSKQTPISAPRRYANRDRFIPAPAHPIPSAAQLIRADRAPARRSALRRGAVRIHPSVASSQEGAGNHVIFWPRKNRGPCEVPEHRFKVF